MSQRGTVVRTILLPHVGSDTDLQASQETIVEPTVAARCRSRDLTLLTISIVGVHSCGYPWKKQ